MPREKHGLKAAKVAAHLGRRMIRELVAFQITPFGKGRLESLK
jgi:hypothetical protein